MDIGPVQPKGNVGEELFLISCGNRKVNLNIVYEVEFGNRPNTQPS